MVIYSATADALMRSGYSAYKNITFTTPSGAHQVDREYVYNVRDGINIGVNLSGITLARADKNASKEIVCTTANNITIKKQILQNNANVAGASWVIIGLNINATSSGVNATCYYNYPDADEADSAIRAYAEDYESRTVGQNAPEWVIDENLGGSAHSSDLNSHIQ